MDSAWLIHDGQSEERKLRERDETQHKVTLTKGFFMGMFTVTQEQWKENMGDTPGMFKGGKNLPVEMVSWDDCQKFIKKLREKDKKFYRLPTEAEWEYACRAGTTTPFHVGQTISTDQANYNGTFVYGNGKKGVNRGKTTPVDSFPANDFGLYDMHGNVWQWCQDYYGDYPQTEVVDPQGPDKGKTRVLRGGSWHYFPDLCRSAYRRKYGPEFRSSDVAFVSASTWSDRLPWQPESARRRTATARSAAYGGSRQGFTRFAVSRQSLPLLAR